MPQAASKGEKQSQQTPIEVTDCQILCSHNNSSLPFASPAGQLGCLSLAPKKSMAVWRPTKALHQWTKVHESTQTKQLADRSIRE